MKESDQSDPVLSWATAHPEESRALGPRFVAVSMAGELVDHDATIDALLERVGATGRTDVVLGRLSWEAGVEPEPSPDARARLTAVFGSRAWKRVESHHPLRRPEIAELRALIEALVR